MPSRLFKNINSLKLSNKIQKGINAIKKKTNENVVEQESADIMEKMNNAKKSK